jgi:hypothetical protein
MVDYKSCYSKILSNEVRIYEEKFDIFTILRCRIV